MIFISRYPQVFWLKYFLNQSLHDTNRFLFTKKKKNEKNWLWNWIYIIPNQNNFSISFGISQVELNKNEKILLAREV